jgi:hypothetical protein
MTVLRGVLLAELSINSCSFPGRIASGDQLGEVCNGIAIGSEFVGSHWIARISFLSPGTRVRSTPGRADLNFHLRG